MKAHILL